MKRVAEGGHNIPVETIYQRYTLGLMNLFEIFMPIVDNWTLFDNNFTTELIADSVSIVNNETFNIIKEGYDNTRKIGSKKDVK